MIQHRYQFLHRPVASMAMCRKALRSYALGVNSFSDKIALQTAFDQTRIVAMRNT